MILDFKLSRWPSVSLSACGTTPPTRKMDTTRLMSAIHIPLTISLSISCVFVSFFFFFNYRKLKINKVNNLLATAPPCPSSSAARPLSIFLLFFSHSLLIFLNFIIFFFLLPLTHRMDFGFWF